MEGHSKSFLKQCEEGLAMQHSQSVGPISIPDVYFAMPAQTFVVSLSDCWMGGVVAQT